MRSVRLEEIATLITSGSRGWAPFYAESGAVFLRMANVRRDSVRLRLNDLQHVRLPTSLREGTRTQVRHEDILISITAELGKIGFVYENELGEAYVNQHLCLLRVEPLKACPEYVAYQLAAPTCWRRFQELNDSGAKAGLNLPSIRSFEIALPSMKDQRRIAEVLHTWDEAIEKTERLIAAKVSLRNQLRRTHVSWDRWPLRPIGELVSSVSRPRPTPRVAYTALGIRSHGKGTFQRRVEHPEEIDMDTVYVVGERDLIVNITFAWEGAIALAKPEDEGCFVSHRFPTFQIDEAQVNRNYLGYAVQSARFIRGLGTASPGGAGRNRVLNKGDFLKIKIPVPPKAQQNRIANVLDNAGHEIALLLRQRDAFATQKRGLMQKLLTGRRPASVRKSREAAA